MKSAYYALLFFVFLAVSCKDKDPKADCGCNGSTISVIENVKASYSGRNNLLLRLKNSDDVVYEELYQLCSQTDSLDITPDIKNPDYTVSGNVKSNCFNGPTLIVQAQFFEITEIRKTL
jgi:hypothetical protein